MFYEGIDGVQNAFTTLQRTDVFNQQIGVKGVRVVEVELLAFFKRHIVVSFIVKIMAKQDNIISQSFLELEGQSGFARSGAAGDSDDDSFHSNTSKKEIFDLDRHKMPISN